MPTYQSHPQRNHTESLDNLIFGLLSTAINRSDLPINQKSFLKRKTNGKLRIIKVVNNLLRSTIVVTFTPSVLNPQKNIDVFFKRYRKNTVEKFGQARRETIVKSYDLHKMADCTQLVADTEEHMCVNPDNLKTINEALPIRIYDFTEIGKDCLYAFEIHAFDVIESKDSKSPLEGGLDLSLVSNRMTKEFHLKIADILNFNTINELIGKWVVLNYMGAFKIKTKDEIFSSYNVLN